MNLAEVDLAQQGPPEAMCRGSHKRAGHGRVDLTGRSLPQLDLATDLAHTQVVVLQG